MITSQDKNNETRSSYADVFLFTLIAFGISIGISWLYACRHIVVPVVVAQFSVGMLAFAMQALWNDKPLMHLYSKNHPYRKLRPYGTISAFVFFEFVLAWGLYSKQIAMKEDDLFLITIVFIGAIIYYHLFIRMKISLRFLFLAIIIPAASAGCAMGLGSYFKILRFIIPAQKIGDIVLFNSFYWILVNIFAQTLCEEPAFRGYLLTRLSGKGEFLAVVVSSLIYAAWFVPFGVCAGMDQLHIMLTFIGNMIIGLIFALLFIKGRNLFVAVISHGIVNGLSMSLFASDSNPGVRQYIQFLTPRAETDFLILWFGCLAVGMVLLTFIPRKKIHAA